MAVHLREWLLLDSDHLPVCHLVAHHQASDPLVLLWVTDLLLELPVVLLPASVLARLHKATHRLVVVAHHLQECSDLHLNNLQTKITNPLHSLSYTTFFGKT
jgi:hypothetical protein